MNYWCEDKRRFFEMVETLGVSRFFDKEKEVYLPDHVEARFMTASEAEKQVLGFCVSVWRGRSVHGFDLIEAVSLLDRERLEVITDWIESPFWP